MTEQEAEAMIKRIRRIWAPKKILLESPPTLQFNVARYITFRSSIRHYRNHGDVWQYTLDHEKYMWLYGSTMKDCYVSPCGQGSRRHAELVEQWFPIFRRNCWLCGCPVQATPEEKAEWMQGFTREEIQAWDLKI